ncbi:MAG: type IV pilin, partial [Methanomassiliicoccales archaeon]
MGKVNFGKKFVKNQKGVSEIIGNILILGITVTLFSSIMYFVVMLPPPQEHTYGDFNGYIQKEGANYVVYLEHINGPPLKDSAISIRLTIDGIAYNYRISDSVPSIGNTWYLGTTWRYVDSQSRITESSRVEAMIIDREKNNIVWSLALANIGANSPPIIMQVWVSVEEQGGIWTTSNQVLQNQNMTIFARLYDADGGSHNVTADLSDLNITTAWGKLVYLEDNNNDGIYSSKVLRVPIKGPGGQDNIGNKRITINATDSSNLKATKNLNIEVLDYRSYPPIIMYAGVEPSSSLLGSQFIIRCYVTDPNNNLIRDSVRVSSDENEKTLGKPVTSHAVYETITTPPGEVSSYLIDNDDLFIAVEKGKTLRVDSWDLPNDILANEDNLKTIVLKIRYYVADNYDPNTNVSRVNISTTGNGIYLLDYKTPVTRVFNLRALGIDTVAELQTLSVVFENKNEGTVYFDYWWLEVTYPESGFESSTLMKEDPINPGYYTAVGVANYQITPSAVSGVFYYTISARDYSGNEAQVRVSHTVITTDFFYQGGGQGGGSPPGNLNYSALQGFSIFEWKDWNTKNFTATPTTIFTHGEKAVVVVASKYLVNLDNENVILVQDPATKAIYSAVSTPNNNFARYDYISGYYIYNTTIDTSKLLNGKIYQIQVQLRDSWVPNNIFFATALIRVGLGTEYPYIKTFSDPSFSTPSTKFTTNDKIY